MVDYLKKLSDEGFITVYGFVIMPNHIHIIWKQNKLNGKETPQGSFLKYTAHEFLKKLKENKTSVMYEVNAANKKHQIWQRDSLSVEIYSRLVAKQKLDYIHFNPVNKKWQLAKDDLDYYFSSARYYETKKDEFGFLNNLYFIFDGE
ncbi:MAG: transposase [Ferruginibacter sp.]|nr:transposase [Ferruginibacter sp.]